MRLSLRGENKWNCQRVAYFATSVYHMIHRTLDIKMASMAAFEKESKRLLLCLEEDQLVIALIEKGNGQWNAVESFSMGKEDWNNMAETLQSIKQQSSLANLRVSDIQLFFRTIAALPIPAILKGDSKLFVQTQFGLQAPDEMFTDEVNAAMHVSLVIPSVQVAAFRHVFPQATWHSTLALLIEQAQKVQGKTMLPQLFLTFSTSLAEIVFMKSDQLLIARCFQYYTTENLLYHLLNTCNQLGISPAEVSIKAQGQVNEHGEVLDILKEYFTHVALLAATAQNRNKEFADLPAHYFTNLIVS